MFNTVEARAAELGGSATMLTEFGTCRPYFDHPDYQGMIESSMLMGDICKNTLT